MKNKNVLESACWLITKLYVTMNSKAPHTHTNNDVLREDSMSLQYFYKCHTSFLERYHLGLNLNCIVDEFNKASRVGNDIKKITTWKETNRDIK